MTGNGCPRKTVVVDGFANAKIPLRKRDWLAQRGLSLRMVLIGQRWSD